MEYLTYLKFVAALIFVLCLMWGLAYVMKRFGLGTNVMIPPSKKRLKIVEILPVDARRRAVLIQRDDTQHLVLLGTSSETVIETNITPPADSDDAKKKPAKKTNAKNWNTKQEVQAKQSR